MAATIRTKTARYRSRFAIERRTRPMYRSRMRKNRSSNQRKKGRRNQTAFAAGSWPLGTGFRRVAQSTGVRIRATSTDRSMEEMTVTENWR